MSPGTGPSLPPRGTVAPEPGFAGASPQHQRLLREGRAALEVCLLEGLRHRTAVKPELRGKLLPGAEVRRIHEQLKNRYYMHASMHSHCVSASYGVIVKDWHGCGAPMHGMDGRIMLN